MVKAENVKSTRDRFNISKWAIKYSWLTVCFWLAVSVAGILAFSSLKYALFPDITFPVVVVNAQAPITSAVDMETQVTKPIEAQVKSLKGLEDIRSSTYPGQTAVGLSFTVGTNLETATKQTEELLKQLKLPQEATYKTIPLNLNESAVVSYAIESKTLPIPELNKLTKDKIVPALTKLSGVLKVTLLGDGNTNPPALPTNGLPAVGTLTRFNGKDAVAVQIIKKGEANTLEVVSLIETEIKKLQSELKDITISLAATQAEYIRNATNDTIDSLKEAIALAVIVIFPFLWNWRATVISALAIPLSLLGTFIAMAYFGFNLETITLLALALVIGSIVDDAIVDVENIVRHIDEGETPKEAALKATGEVGLPVIAATFTAVGVFLPIGLMSGVVGQFFKPFGITVSVAMLTSMMVARTLTPVLSIYWLKPKPNHGTPREEKKFWSKFDDSYRNLLDWSLKHRAIVVGLGVFSLVAGIALIPLIPKGFIPKLDRGEFNVVYTAPLPEIPNLAELQKQAATPDLAALQAKAAQGDAAAQAALQQAAPPDLAALQAKAAQGDAAAQAALQQAAQARPNIPIPNPLNDSLEVAKKLEAVIIKNPNVETVFTTVGSREGEPNKGKIYIKLKADRNIKTAEIQDQLRKDLPQIAGVKTSVEDIQFVDTGGEKPLQIALQGEDLEALNKAATTIKERVEKIPGFADVSITGEGNKQGAVVQIERLNNQRVAYISANLGQNLTLGNATDKIVAEAKAVLPSNISLNLGGDSERQGEVFASFGSTLGLSALCIILVLVWLFRSWVDPIVIGISLPMAIVGALLALLLTNSDFGMISLIGFVFLLGISNKNAILLVDCINQLRDEGLEKNQAILEAAPVRFRPIMMTTVSTILGMMPVAISFGAGAELRSPMAVAIAGGLVSSTILSLIVIPVIYAILDDWFPRYARKKGRGAEG
ncbi:MAG TPA: efflux RND transporter permease subunit [Nostocaceae cyanobacterium]|nr:efflux RND transporter permease subunit [Nostocaceae cyanobacterium]